MNPQGKYGPIYLGISIRKDAAPIIVQGTTLKKGHRNQTSPLFRPVLL